MGANRRIKRVGEFCWQHSDLGVECLRCGLVRVYCDWEAAERFQERGWSPAVDEAVKRFRCSCGSRDVRFAPVPIYKRPKPVPIRPAPLRPIYAENRRSLARRSRAEPHDRAAVDAALDEMRQALTRRGAAFQTEGLKAAIEALRPLIYQTSFLDEFWTAGADPAPSMWHGAGLDMALKHVLRQLGRPAE
jgi:hypothetical protein